MRSFILITGASSGIGESAAAALVKAGYHVVAGVRSRSDVERLSVRLGPSVHPVILDVTDALGMEKARSDVETLLGDDPLVAIINNAGIAIHGAVLYIPLEEWEKQFDINVFGVVRTTQTFFPLLVRQKKNSDRHPRRIINISSVSGLFASPFLGPYCASKFALEALSDSLRRELFMYDVEVILIEPGNIQSLIWEKAKKAKSWFGPEYESVLALKDKIIDSNISGSLPSSVTDKAILHAVGAKKVKNRYLLLPKKWKFILIRMLPAAWIDHMIRSKLSKGSGFRP